MTVGHTADHADDERRSTVAEVLTRYMSAQLQAIAAGDVWLRRGLDLVHSTRVGIRRLRSTLRVFKALFEPDARMRLDAELSWYAGLLGGVRDRQVQRKRFSKAVGAIPAELIAEPPVASTVRSGSRTALRCMRACAIGGPGR